MSGLLANTGTNGNDRYLSGNYLGARATNSAPRDAFDNFAFTFVTLTGLPVQPPDPDSDGDGLPDAWERHYFGGPTNAVAGLDDDADGMINADEFRAGTDPRNNASRIDIVSQSVTGAMHRITFQTVGGKAYWVDRATNLLDGAAGFQAVTNVTEQDVPDGIGGMEAFTDGAAPGERAYFRIRHEP